MALLNNVLVLLGGCIFALFLSYVLNEYRMLRNQARLARELKLKEELRDEYDAIKKNVSDSSLESLVDKANARHRGNDFKS